MVNIKEGLKKSIKSLHKTIVVDPSVIKRVKKVAEAAQKEAKILKTEKGEFSRR